MTIKPQGSDSLVIETTDTNGSPLAGVKVYAPRAAIRNTPLRAIHRITTIICRRPIAVRRLIPAVLQRYLISCLADIFCGDAGATNCKIGGTTYYLAAAIPYGGTNSLQPITVPTYDPSNPSATTFAYGGTNYLQKVRLMLTTNANFPRVATLAPYDVAPPAAPSRISLSRLKAPTCRAALRQAAVPRP